MKRQSFINWERVTEDNKPENGKRYLTAEIVEEDVAKLSFATWYDKGSIVQIPAKPEKGIDEMTAEERLLQCIFGSYKEYEVPESGFYLLTSDYGVDEKIENGAFAGCEQMLIDLSDNIFFAEEPLVPEGYLTETQDKERTKSKNKQIKLSMQEEELATIDAMMENNDCVRETITNVLGKHDLSHNTIVTNRYEYAVYTLSEVDIANKIIEADKTITALNILLEEEGDIETIAATLHEAIGSNTYSDCLHQMINRKSLEYMPYQVKRYLIMYIESVFVDADFYYYRNKFAKQFEQPSQVMIASHAAHSISVRLERSAKLRRIGAPIVIQTNELRMLANSIIEFSYVRKLSEVSEGFENEFGIYKDGSKFEGDSVLGNLENQTVPVYYEPENDEGVQEEDELYEPEDRYFIVSSPNYAYKQGLYSLWNPKLKYYYRKDGQVAVFLKWKDARDTREKLNA